VISVPPVAVDGSRFVDGVRCDRLLLDIAQSAGKVHLDFRASGADLAVLSAHKLGGPKGVGALIVRDGTEVEALLCGGGQELGRRSGTENVVGIAGFGAAALDASLDLEAGLWAEVESLRDDLENALEDSGKETIFVGRDSRRLPNTSCFVTPGWKGETQVMQMDLAGFAVSSGSACSSGKVKGSRVLRAMGLDAQEAECALRVSIGPTTTEKEVMRFADAWTKQEGKLRQRAA
jgi:cysteine desulfurase